MKETKADMLELRSLLERFGVADDLDWLSTILFVRNLVANIGIFKDQSKTELQHTVLKELASKDLSRETFHRVIDHIEQFIKHNDAYLHLQQTLEHERRASQALIEEIDALTKTLHGSSARQEQSIDRFGKETVKAVEAGESKTGIVKQVRGLLTELVSELKEEARNWEERAKALEHHANYDPMLTELFNRRSFDNYLSDIVVKSESRNIPLSLMMIDVDHFKLVNDNYGHQVGDDLLRALATIITNHAVIYDGYAARYGGEELVVVCPMGLDKTEAAANAIRKDVADYEFVSRKDGKLGEAIHFTISIGVAQLERGWDADQLVAAADSALYTAKGSGRNKVAAHKPPSKP